MKCMYAQTRPRFILSSEGVFGGMEFEPMLTPREKSPLPKMSPEEDRTRDAGDSEPKHYQLSYSGPRQLDCENCRLLTVVDLHDTAPGAVGFFLQTRRRRRRVTSMTRPRKNPHGSFALEAYALTTRPTRR